MKITLLGMGAWATALARLLIHQGHTVTLWGHDPEQIERLRYSRRNEAYLPGIDLPDSLGLSHNLQVAVAEAELVVAAVASRFFRPTVSQLADFRGIIVSVTKGIEYDTGLTMSGILEQVAPQSRVAALSGPTLALEVARGIPTAIVAASHHSETAHTVQSVFHRPEFRVYTSTDLLGVELGGALKNVIAIAAGVCDGLGFGDNSKAALITRGIAEIRRLGIACGALSDTFAGLSGIGDLTVTCFSKLSRNRGYGERLGSGEQPEAITASMLAVAEGVPTARAAQNLARRLRVDTPIIDEVHAMIHEGKAVAEAVRDLTSRESKPED